VWAIAAFVLIGVAGGGLSKTGEKTTVVYVTVAPSPGTVAAADIAPSDGAAPSVVPAPTSPAPEPTEAPKAEFTVSQENAIESAESYLDSGAFSEVGLIQQLSSKYGEGFPKADAVFAVNHINVNWNEQAAKSAKSYLDSGSFSCQGLIDQLESKYGEGFTHSQAVYGAKQTGLC
jgi:hypothetical protein